MSNSSKTSLCDWLVRHCDLSADDAAELENRLRKKCFIESVGSLRQCALSTPDVLDDLRLSKSFKLKLFDQLGTKGVKSISDMTVSEVSVVLQNIFPEHQQYSAALFRSRISGFVLSSVTSCQRLIDMGIREKDHALCLLGYLSSWRESGVPEHYLRVAEMTSLTSPIKMVPRKRTRDENVHPNSAVETSSAEPTHDIHSANNTSNFVISVYLNKLTSPDETVRVNALLKLYKEAEKDKSIVNAFLHTGLLDRLLSMINDPIEDVVHKMLHLLNLIIQRGDEATLDFLVLHKKVFEKIGSKIWSLSHRVRMEIVRIVNSVVGTVHHPTLLQQGAVQFITNMYFMAIAGARARDAEEVRHRIALALKTLCVGVQNPQDCSVLKLCLPVLRDILATDQNGLTTLPAVCATVRNLIELSAGKIASVETAETVENVAKEEGNIASVVNKAPEMLEEITRLVLPPLTTRLNDKKEIIVLQMLTVLSTYTECYGADQLAALLPALVALQKLLASGTSSLEVQLAVVQFLLPLCQLGKQAVTLLIDAQLFPTLVQMILATEVKSEFSQGAELEQDIKKTAAQAYFAAMEHADDNQLPYFLGLGGYTELLKIIAMSAVRVTLQDVLLQALRLLRELILRVEGIDEGEISAEDEQAEVEAWMMVQRLKSGCAVQSHAQIRQEDQKEVRRVVDRKEVSEEIQQAATALVHTARSLGILQVHNK